MEIKLTNVARASLEELLADYRDFLRVRGIAEWDKDHPYAKRLRDLNRAPGANYDTFKKGIESSDPAICANVIIGLIKVTTYLLDRQIQRLEKDFVEQGGLRERLLLAIADGRFLTEPDCARTIMARRSMIFLLADSSFRLHSQTRRTDQPRRRRRRFTAESWSRFISTFFAQYAWLVLGLQ